jgi:caa(3)-type oxidase subunit IV
MAYYFDHERVKEDHPAAHTDSVPTVVTIYLILVIGAIANIGVSFAGLGDASIYVNMTISTLQVCLVGYFWMHLQRSDSLTWLVALSAFFIMILLFALPLTDFLTRRYGGL